MALSTNIKLITAPGKLDLSIFVGSLGQSFQRDFIISTGTPPVAENLTSVTPTAEIRTLDDALIIAMTAVVTNAATGALSISLTRAQADSIAWPVTGSVIGQRTIRGRWHLRLDDGTTSMPVVAGDVTVTR